jgi:hypothetical protein
MNSKKAITLLILTTMILSLVPLMPVYAISDPTTDVTSGVYGDTVVVTGTGATGGYDVKLYWDSPKAWDGEKGLLNTSEAEADGTWEIWFDVPEAVNGSHYLYVQDDYTSDLDKDDDAFRVNATLEFDVDSALPTDEVTVYGYGFMDEAEIEYLFMTNTTNYNKSLSLSPSTPETNDVGTWSATFDVPSSILYGDYNFTSRDEDGVKVTNSTFTVGAAISIDIKEGPTGTVVEVEGRGLDDAVKIGMDNVTLGGVKCHVIDGPIDVRSNGQIRFDCVIPGWNTTTNDETDTDEYKLMVNDGTSAPTATFEITGLPEIEATPSYGPQGSTIQIAGWNYSAVSDGEVTGYLNNTDLEDWETGNDGEFTGSFQIPGIASGNYVLYVESTDYNINASTNFRVGTMFAFVNPDEGPTGEQVTLTCSGFTDSGNFNATFGDMQAPEWTSSMNVDADGTITNTFTVPTVEPGVYTITVLDIDEDIEVTTDYTVTEKSMLELDPITAPNDYNVTIDGDYFTAVVDTDLEFVLWNDTDSWDMTVEYGGNAVKTLEDGNFTGYWGVPDDETLSVGTYTINCTDDNDLYAQISFSLVEQTQTITPKKSAFRIGDIVGFDIRTSFSEQNSYIEIMDPDGNLYWNTTQFTTWVKVGDFRVVPYYTQLSQGQLMELGSDAPLGEWSWTWYEAGGDELDDGTFTVEAAAADVVGEQVADLNNQITDLADQLTDVTTEFDDVKSDIADVAAIAEQAVTAAQQAAEAVQTVAQTANTASQAASDAAEAANAARDAANGLTTLVYGAIGAALVAALAAIVSLMQISRRIAG